MAISNIKANIKEMYFNMENKILRDKANRRFAHVIRINYDTFGASFANSVNDLWKSSTLTPSNQKQDVCDPNQLSKNAETVGEKWANGGFTHAKIENIVNLGDGIEIFVADFKSSLNDTSINFINRSFREQIWTEFEKTSGILRDTLINIHPNDPNYGAKNTGTNFETLSEGVAFGTGFSHSQNTNVAAASLIQFLEKLNPGTGGSLGIETIDIAQLILNRLEINWQKERFTNPQTGKVEERWVIIGELGGSNPAWLQGTDLGTMWEDRVMDILDDVAADPQNKLYQTDIKGSKTFEEDAADATVRKIIKPYKKLRDSKGRFIKMTGVPKKPKNVRQKSKQKPLKKASTKSKGVKVIPSTITANVAGKQEKGTAPKDTDNAVQLQKLKKYIQSRLPAEVRRNMGRPALINRTGRFSNSVQLLSLMEGKNTLMGKYTYLLSPYETFENTGKRRWPIAYNPKTIITKSIRNLAEGRISQKLTLRRV